MNWTLLSKECWELRICIFLILAVYGFSEIYELTTGFPDLPTPEEGGEDEGVFSALLFGIILGASLLGSERDQQTSGFLDGLPVSRSFVFLHKTFAAFTVVMFEILIALALWLVRVRLSSTSISQTVEWPVIGTFILVRAILGMTVTGAAVLLSYSRQWFPLVAGLALLGYTWFRSTLGDYGSWIDSTALVSTDWASDSATLPWKQIYGHTILAVAAWSMAAIAFQWRDGILNRLLDRIFAWKYADWLISIGRLMAIFVWLFAVGFLMEGVESDSGNGIETAAGQARLDSDSATMQNATSGVDPFATYQSQSYTLVFRESQRTLVDGLFWSMDEVHEQVREFFQYPPALTAPIVVDLCSVVSSHAAGQASWTKIRVPLSDQSSVDFLQILRHETAHVYIEQLSDGRARDTFNTMRMFHEGIATAVELGGSGSSDLAARLRMNKCAAANDSRGRVRLNVLLNDKILKRERNADLVYPLGFIVANALNDVGGPTLPRRMLEALRTTKFPPGVTPAEVWRIVLQECGTSLELVIVAYEDRLDTLAKLERSFVSNLPRLKGTVNIEDDEIIIRPEAITAEPSRTMVCMVERNRVLAMEEEYVPIGADGWFRIPRSTISGNKFRYLLGWRTAESSLDIFEPWAEADLTK